MPASRRDTLGRLVRITRRLYEWEAAKAAQLGHAKSELSKSVEDTYLYLHEAEQAPTFLTEMALARASRLRQHLERADGELNSQLAVAVDAFSTLKGAEALLDDLQESAIRTAALATLNEAIDGVLARREASVKQG